VFVPRPSLSPLAERDFRLFFVGQTASTLGSAFASVALAFAVLQTTGSVGDVGFALAATRVPLLVFVLAGGVAGDRFSRRSLMLASDAGRFLTQAIAAALLLTGTARLWELLVLFALHGFAQAFFNPASVGLVAAVAPSDRLQEANGLLSFARSGAGAIGLLAGGALVTLVGPGLAFGVDSFSFLVSAAALASLRLPSLPAAPKTAASFAADLRAGWSEFRSRSWLWIGTVHIALLNAFALAGFFALGPVVAADDLGGGYAWGVIGAAFAVGMAAGGASAVRLKPGRMLFAAFAAVALAAPQLALLAIAAPLPLVAFAAFFGGAQSSFWGTLWTTTLQREIPANVLARVASYNQVGSLLLAPAGMAAVGAAAAAFGTGPVLWFGAVWVVVSTALILGLSAIRGHETVEAVIAAA
jgi:MFS family permease